MIPILTIIAMTMIIIINEDTDDSMIAMSIDVKSSWALLYRKQLGRSSEQWVSWSESRPFNRESLSHVYRLQAQSATEQCLRKDLRLNSSQLPMRFIIFHPIHPLGRQQCGPEHRWGVEAQFLKMQTAV